jgi:hypothetical protein
MIAKLEGHASWAEGATFSPDGARAVTFAAKEDAKLWDGVTGAPLAVLTGHEGGATSATFNADGSRIATADPAHHMRLWNGATGALVAKIGGRSEGASWDVVFSPDGSRLLTNTYTPRAEGSDEWTATLWAAASGERLAILGGHKGGMNPSFTKDGSRILTVGPLYEAERLNDRTPRLWDGATGRPIAALDAAETRRFRPFGKQLFALSGVSGGALGSVFIYGALADGQTSRRAINGIGRPPCRKFNSDRLWFATALGEGVKGASPSGTELPWRKPDESWRGCLELVSAGDFLSPVFVALAANDPFRIDIRGDRAAILEQAWETRYASLTGQDTAMGAVRKGDAQSNAPSSTLAESLSAVRNRVLTADPKGWLPMLILNGTSVTTGRRIVASDIATVSDEQGSLSRLFRDAYDLHELFSETGPVGEPGRKTSEPRCPDCDIRLSTAATMSARFPVISPHGTIRNRDGEIVDHIVDGGYFENFGATSAMELAGALEANELKPFVILVNNEPTLSGMDCIREDKRMDYSRDVASPAFSVFTSPMGALFATRGARGTHAAVEL